MRQLHTLADAVAVGLTLVAVCRNIRCRRRVKLDVAALAYQIGEGQPLLPEKGKRHFSEKLRCSECRHVGAAIWPEDPKGPEPAITSLSYAVNEWYAGNTVPMKAIARVGHLQVARDAYASAILSYPNRRITLQQGAFVIEDSRFTVLQGGRAS